jgi:hypothetical protein
MVVLLKRRFVMKKLMIILFIIFPIFHGHAQIDSIESMDLKVLHGEVGFSFGKGFGMDFGLGNITNDDPFHQHGLIYLASVYVPYFGTNNPDKFGLDLGLRYIINRFSFGIMADLLREVNHQDYYTNFERHTSDLISNKWGVIFTTSYKFSSYWCVSVFAGTRRSIMLGLLYIY